MKPVERNIIKALYDLLKDNKEVNCTMVSDILGFDVCGRITKPCKDLENQGFIKRIRIRSSRTILRLTAKGRTKAKTIKSFSVLPVYAKKKYQKKINRTGILTTTILDPDEPGLGASHLPRQKATDDYIARLYNGHRYEDVKLRRKVSVRPPMPARPSRYSLTSCGLEDI